MRRQTLTIARQHSGGARTGERRHRVGGAAFCPLRRGRPRSRRSFGRMLFGGALAPLRWLALRLDRFRLLDLHRLGLVRLRRRFGFRRQRHLGLRLWRSWRDLRCCRRLRRRLGLRLRLRRLGLLHLRTRREIERTRLRRRSHGRHVDHDRGQRLAGRWRLCVVRHRRRDRSGMHADDHCSRQQPARRPPLRRAIVQRAGVHGCAARPSRPTSATFR